MIDTIIDNNVERIESDLKKRGLTYDRLIDDVLDHVCCLVEEQMESGIDFESSYSGVLDSIGDKRLPEIEYQTLLLLNKKFQRMKKVTYVIGLTSALMVLFGTLSKYMHWPGAGIELSIGLLAIVLVFLPLYFIVTYKEQAEKKNIIYPLVGYLTLASLLVGAVFKVQHWPGAHVVVAVSMGVLIVGFVPLYLVNAFQKAKGEKIGLPYITMLIVGVAIISLSFNVRMAKETLEEYRSEAINNELIVAEIETITEKVISMVPDSISENINLIHAKASELQIMIDNMLEEMLVSIKEPGVSLETLEKIDRGGAGRDVIVENGWARKFIGLSRDYQLFLMEIIDDPVTRAQIGDHLEFNGEVWYNEWGKIDVMYDPVIKIYYKHTYVSKGIALSEYVAVKYLIDR